MLSEYVVPGSKIEIRPINQEDLGEELLIKKKVYQSQVSDILSEDRLEILMPMENTRLISLPVNSEYQIYFFTENGIYQSSAIVVDVYKPDKNFVLLLQLTAGLRKTQRREYYRLDCAIGINIRPLEEDEMKAAARHDRYLKPDLPFKQAVAVDISGGGLRFVGDYPYEPNSLIYCQYSLDMGEKKKDYSLMAKILVSIEVENKPGSYEHRAQYINIDTSEREEIIRFIFEEERKRRKREKGL